MLMVATFFSSSAMLSMQNFLTLETCQTNYFCCQTLLSDFFNNIELLSENGSVTNSYLSLCTHLCKINLTCACLLLNQNRHFLEQFVSNIATPLISTEIKSSQLTNIFSSHTTEFLIISTHSKESSFYLGNQSHLTDLQNIWLNENHRVDYRSLRSSEKYGLRSQITRLCEAGIAATCARRLTSAFCNVRHLPTYRPPTQLTSQIQGNQEQLNKRRDLIIFLLNRAMGGSTTASDLAECICYVSYLLPFFSSLAARQTPAQRVMTIERLLACTKRRDPLIFNA